MGWIQTMTSVRGRWVRHRGMGGRGGRRTDTRRGARKMSACWVYQGGRRRCGGRRDRSFQGEMTASQPPSFPPSLPAPTTTLHSRQSSRQIEFSQTTSDDDATLDVKGWAQRVGLGLRESASRGQGRKVFNSYAGAFRPNLAELL